MNSGKSIYGPLGVVICLMLLSQCGGNSPDAIFNQGLRAIQDQDPIGASLYFDDFINKFPEDERAQDAHFLLVRCYYQMGDYAGARKVLEEAKRKFSAPNIRILCDFEIGRTYFNQGDFGNAASQYSSIADATTNPQIRVDAYSYLASVYAKQIQPASPEAPANPVLAASAEAAFDAVFQIAEKDVADATESMNFKLRALNGEADVYKLINDFDKARNFYRQAFDIVKEGTGIVGIEAERQNELLQLAHTWAEAGDYISSATIYDHLLVNPYVLPALRPELIYYKIQSLHRLFEDDRELSPEETRVLVSENLRLVNNEDYSKTDRGVAARVEIASLVKDSTPEMSNKYLDEAVEMYRKIVEEPPSPKRMIEAKFQIAGAYIEVRQFDKARLEINNIKQEHKDNPAAVQDADSMLYYIRQQEAKIAKEAQEAKTEATPSGEASSATSP